MMIPFSRFRGLLALVAIPFLPLPSLAQLPAATDIQADLANLYQTTAAQPPAKHRGPLMRALEPLMIQQARYLVGELRPWAKDPGAALLPLMSKAPSGENGIRPNAHTAKGLALLVRLAPDEVFPADFTRAQARTAALSLVRYLVRTHGAGGETCADGKPWHNQWQSAYWATLTGEAAWLLWDDLTPAERWLTARMVCDEADRFVGVPPPTNVVDDSKAEENAWNSQILSLAHNLFTGHPRNKAWQNTAIRWIVSSFATSRDVTSAELVDRVPLKEWLTGPNIHEDFTLENHRRVHPDYMACTYLLTSQIPMYAWGGNRVPQAIHHNAEAMNATLKRLATPEGSVLYPNGQDWGLHRNVDWLEYHAMMAVVYQDRQSAALLRHSLAAVTQMAARTPGGAVYLPGETKLASDQHMVLEYAAHVYALMAQLGEGPEPVPDAQLWQELSGSRVFLAGKFGLARTANAAATFSWGAQVMGQVLPLRADLLLSPETRGLVGHVAIEGVPRESPVTKQVAVAPLADGFGVTGVLERAGGAVEQRFGFLALPDGRAVYVDVLTLTGPARPSLLNLGTLGVLNDVRWPFHDGTRTLAYEGGVRTFVAASAATEAPLDVDSRWFNLDGALGLVRLAASGRAVYTPAPTGAAGRIEQRFNLNTVPADTLAAAQPGRPLAYGAYVLYPNQTDEQTKAAAGKCVLLSAPGVSPVRLRLEDATEVAFDLTALRLAITPPPPPVPAAAEVQALAERVAARHLALPRAHHPDSWMRAVFYAGALALHNPRIDDGVLQLIRPLQWQLKQRVYHADDHAIAQAYLELYFRQRDPAMIAPLRARFDYILAHPKTGSIDRAQNLEPHSVWSWCDALFMAAPVWAGLAQATGNPAYSDFAVAGWWKTSDFLYDHEARLFHRDSGSMADREANGAQVFWGRGNGWVMAALARVLTYLPADHPARPRFEQQLREMASSLAALQQPDGLWRASLLDPASFPAPEVSGSGLICYALAWGINHEVLDRATYAPVALRAWQGLTRCVTPDGEVTNVQPIGAEPAKFDAKATEDYGVGAVLLAASEVRQLGSSR